MVFNVNFLFIMLSGVFSCFFFLMKIKLETNVFLDDRRVGQNVIIILIPSPMGTGLGSKFN